MPPPERFGLPDRYDTIGSDRLSAFVFFLTFALVAGTVVFFALGSGWGFPEMPGLIPAPTRDNSLFPSAQATGEPTAEPTASSVMPTQTPTPTPQPTPTQTVYVVGNTGGDGAWLRRSPHLADHLKAWPDNTRMVDMGEDVNSEGLPWHKVRDPQGNIGYIPAKWLVVIQQGQASQPTPQAQQAQPQPQQTPPTVSPTATPTPSPQSPKYYVVGNTGGDGGVWLRRSPNLNDKMLIWPDGNRMERIGPDVNAGGMVWIHVRDPRGNEGYIPAQWLIPVN
ncbi:MAG: hypothetical protein ACYC1C_10765 [Chloroflexota bacterium]